ncbi:hypothetical protein S83_025074 [Arachis hypogaea]|nr:uncharacterized protein DS421_8g231160 [Arachis hypogaea]
MSKTEVSIVEHLPNQYVNSSSSIGNGMYHLDSWCCLVGSRESIFHRIRASWFGIPSNEDKSPYSFSHFVAFLDYPTLCFIMCLQFDTKVLPEEISSRFQT